MPEIFIIAGCNGAGKTTAAYNLLPEVFKTVEFVNADEIARGISPFNPESVAFHAGRIMLERLEDLIKNNKSLAFETTLSGLGHLQLLQKARQNGYNVILFFVYLNSYALAKRRVAFRVSKGGHDIPANVIERRYKKGLLNFRPYANRADSWYIYDNSGSEYVLAAKFLNNKEEIFNFDVFHKVNGNDAKKEN